MYCEYTHKWVRKVRQWMEFIYLNKINGWSDAEVLGRGGLPHSREFPTFGKQNIDRRSSQIELIFFLRYLEVCQDFKWMSRFNWD